jgi:hypothetical protein
MPSRNMAKRKLKRHRRGGISRAAGGREAARGYQRAAVQRRIPRASGGARRQGGGRRDSTGATGLGGRSAPVQEEALEVGERVQRERHQRQVEGAQDEESRRLRGLWETKKRKRETGREDGVDAGNVDGASHGRFQMGALGQSRAKAARAGRSGALRVTPAAASAGTISIVIYPRTAVKAR